MFLSAFKIRRASRSKPSLPTESISDLIKSKILSKTKTLRQKRLRVSQKLSPRSIVRSLSSQLRTFKKSTRPLSTPRKSQMPAHKMSKSLRFVVLKSTLVSILTISSSTTHLLHTLPSSTRRARYNSVTREWAACLSNPHSVFVTLISPTILVSLSTRARPRFSITWLTKLPLSTRSLSDSKMMKSTCSCAAKRRIDHPSSLMQLLLYMPRTTSTKISVLESTLEEVNLLRNIFSRVVSRISKLPVATKSSRKTTNLFKSPTILIMKMRTLKPKSTWPVTFLNNIRTPFLMTSRRSLPTRGT